MLKNYLKIAVRQFTRNKIYSAINILGLVVGIVCCLLIGLYIAYELSYDKFHKDADRIYRIAWWSDNPQTRTPHPMAQALVRDLPEVEAAVSISPIWGPGLTRPAFSVRYQDKQFNERGFFSADSTFLKIFSLNLIRGDDQTALTRPGGVIITKEMAKKYFGSVDVVGKTLKMNETYDLEVSGVLENIPSNSHFYFDFLISYVTLKPLNEGEYYTWADFGHYNYIKLKAGANPSEVEAKLPQWSGRYIDWSEEDYTDFREGRIGFKLQPLTDIHLYSNIRWELEANGNIAYIYIFIGAALFILIIACINFMNLTTARSLTRAQEVGMRKSIGATRSQLVLQFLSESVLTVAVSVVFALVVLDLILPWFREFTGIHSGLTLTGWRFWTGLALGTISLGLLSGSYPAFVLSRYKPVRVLKGKFLATSEGLWLRKGLVILQFTVSIILISGTLLIYKQLEFLQNKELGFKEEQIAVIPINNDRIRTRFDALKNQILNIPGIRQVTAVSNIPGGRFNQNAIRWRSDDPLVDVSELRADHDFLETLDIKLLEGRDFSKNHPEDLEGRTYLLNETAARQFDWHSSIGKEITWFDDDLIRKGRIIGVVGDFHIKSLHQPITPLIIQVQPEEYNYVLVKLREQNIAHTIPAIEEIWRKFDTTSGFEYSFLDDEFNLNYRAEQKTGSILATFSILAVVIACLGLLGLTNFAVRQRVKEIGIRKVLGAGIGEIVRLFSWQFIQLVFAALCIAIPIVLWIMGKWLQNFAYRTEIGVLIFIITGIFALAIAQITITTITIKAAKMNPIKSLRNE